MPSREKSEFSKFRTKISRVLISCLVSLSIFTGSNLKPEISKLKPNTVAVADFFNSKHLNIDYNKLKDATKLVSEGNREESEVRLAEYITTADEATKKEIIKAVILGRLNNHGGNVLLQFRQALGTDYDNSAIAKHDLFENTSHNFVEQADEAGNMSYFVEVDLDNLEAFVKTQKGNTVLNFSFQIGKFGVKYLEYEVKYNPNNFGEGLFDDNNNFYPNAVELKTSINGEITYLDKEGNIVIGIPEKDYVDKINSLKEANKVIVKKSKPELQILGAFTPDNPFRKENFKKLVDFVSKFPNLLFVISTGNYQDNYLDLGKLPKNVVLACGWFVGTYYPDSTKDSISFERPDYGVIGEDMICVNINKHNLPFNFGTSFVAPVVTAEITKIMQTRKVGPFEALRILKNRAKNIDGNYLIELTQ